MTAEDRRKWDERYADWHKGRQPFNWLVEHAPPSEGGIALDLACGGGHNTIHLAEAGYKAVGIDGSRFGVAQGLAAAREHGVADRVLFAQADLDTYRPAPNSCDLVCVIRFLSRDLFPWLTSALRPGGRLIYATLNWRWVESHPDVNPDYLLRPGELLEAFGGLSVIDHREDGDISHIAAFKSPAS